MFGGIDTKISYCTRNELLVTITQLLVTTNDSLIGLVIVLVMANYAAEPLKVCTGIVYIRNAITKVSVGQYQCFFKGLVKIA